MSDSVVYVLGLDYEVKDTIPWTDAVCHILKGTMTPFKVHETKRVRSHSVNMAWPLIVRLNYWVSIPPRKEPDLNSRASRCDILRRDGWTCAYCGGKVQAGKIVVEDDGVERDLNPTVDHIIPESRGGEWTWGNLVACCASCNQLKADRTPEEAGMKLLWSPHSGKSGRYPRIQNEVWRILEEGGGFIEEAVHYEGLIA